LVGEVVRSALINPDGTLGSWTTEANQPPEARTWPAASIWNGRLYIVGGQTGGTLTSTLNVCSAPILSDGSLGVWRNESTLFPAHRFATEWRRGRVACMLPAVRTTANPISPSLRFSRPL